MKKCPQCGRSYSDNVTRCPACNIAIGEIEKPKPDKTFSQTGSSNHETDFREKAATQAQSISSGQQVKRPGMGWCGYLGLAATAIFIYAFMHNLSLFGMKDAISETFMTIPIAIVPLFCFDWAGRERKSGNIPAAQKPALIGVLSIVAALLYCIF